MGEEIPNVYEIDASFDKKILLLQAHLVYDLAFDAKHKRGPVWSDNDYEKLMGVSALLHHILDESLKVKKVMDHDNTGVY
jgi:hypothetical protein